MAHSRATFYQSFRQNQYTYNTMLEGSNRAFWGHRVGVFFLAGLSETREVEMESDSDSSEERGSQITIQEPGANLPHLVGPLFEVEEEDIMQGEADWRLSLIGLFVDERNLKEDRIIERVRFCWNQLERVSIKTRVEGTNIFIFQLSSESMLEKVLKESPWSIDGSLLLLQKYSSFTRVRDLSYDFVPLWVELHDVPFELLSPIGAALLGNFVGDVVEIDRGRILNVIRHYLRVRIMVDVTKPLLPGFFISWRGNKTLWIKVQYERVQTVCQKCCTIGHRKLRCIKSFQQAVKGIRGRIREVSDKRLIVVKEQRNLKMYSRNICAHRGSVVTKFRMNYAQEGPRIGEESEDDDEELYIDVFRQIQGEHDGFRVEIGEHERDCY